MYLENNKLENYMTINFMSVKNLRIGNKTCLLTASGDKESINSVASGCDAQRDKPHSTELKEKQQISAAPCVCGLISLLLVFHQHV